MVKKATLAKFIAQGSHDVRSWYDFMPKITGLRVKEVGSQGEVLISLDSTGWIKPDSWLANYRASMREELHRELDKAEAVLAPQELEAILLQYCQVKRSDASCTGLKPGDTLHFMKVAEDATRPQGERCVQIIKESFRRLDQATLGESIVTTIRNNPQAK